MGKDVIACGPHNMHVHISWAWDYVEWYLYIGHVGERIMHAQELVE